MKANNVRARAPQFAALLHQFPFDAAQKFFKQHNPESTMINIKRSGCAPIARILIHKPVYVAWAADRFVVKREVPVQVKRVPAWRSPTLKVRHA